MVQIIYRNGDTKLELNDPENDAYETVFLTNINYANTNLILESLDCSINLDKNFVEIYPTNLNSIEEVKMYLDLKKEE